MMDGKMIAKKRLNKDIKKERRRRNFKKEIIEYLIKMMDEDGRKRKFFRAKHLSNELGIGSRRIGSYLGRLSKEGLEEYGLRIEKWSNSSSFSWVIEKIR